jgi:hypothetical protein
VFETTQLCIGSLGHLHHTLTPEHLKKLGQIDVLLVPVDGGYRGRLCVWDGMWVRFSVHIVERFSSFAVNAKHHLNKGIGAASKLVALIDPTYNGQDLARGIILTGTCNKTGFQQD